jgi:hypothetical protein
MELLHEGMGGLEGLLLLLVGQFLQILAFVDLLNLGKERRLQLVVPALDPRLHNHAHI